VYTPVRRGLLCWFCVLCAFDIFVNDVKLGRGVRMNMNARYAYASYSYMVQMMLEYGSSVKIPDVV